MFLSPDNRQLLHDSLLKAIPVMEHDDTRQLFTLIYALLCDLEEVLLDRKTDAERYWKQISSIEERLNRVVENGKLGDQVVQ